MRQKCESQDFHVYLLSPYVIHSASTDDCPRHRAFVKICFSRRRFFDSRELRRSPAIDTSEFYREPTVGRKERFVQHYHPTERWLAADYYKGW